MQDHMNATTQKLNYRNGQMIKGTKMKFQNSASDILEEKTVDLVTSSIIYGIVHITSRSNKRLNFLQEKLS